MTKQTILGLCTRLVAFAIVAAMMIGTTMVSPSVVVRADKVSDKKEELEELREEQKKLEQSIKNLGSDIESQKKKVNTLYKQVSNLESQITAYENKIADADKIIADQDARIAQLNTKIAEKEKLMEEILNKLKKRVKAITKTGNYSSFQMLMNTENYEDYLLKSQVIKCVAEHDDRLQDQANAEKAAIAEARGQIETEKADSEANKAELEKLKGELDTQFSSLDALYTKAYNEKQSLEKKLGTYESEKKKIEAAEAALEREIAELLNNPTSDTYGGKMYWPVPAVKQISCSYGQKKTYFHGGTDIWGPGILKKPILAAADGTVVKSVKMHYSYGNYVMVDHGTDEKGRRIMTLYAHMYSAPPVKVGDKVVGGVTKLGLVGSTGNSTGPHLHFEVRVDGKRVDPIGQGYIVRPK